MPSTLTFTFMPVLTAPLLSSNSWFYLHSPKTLYCCFLKTAWLCALFTLCVLSKEVCLQASAVWPSSSVSQTQRVATGQLTPQLLTTCTGDLLTHIDILYPMRCCPTLIDYYESSSCHVSLRMIMMVVAFSSLARIQKEFLTVYSPPLYFFFFFFLSGD